jgi:alkylation response protein AidB-like acyl-CoA dehydrogenase
VSTPTRDGLIELRQPIRRLAAERFDRRAVHESAQPPGLDRVAWRAICDLGVIGMMAPESQGGLGLGLSTAVGVWEECGNGLVPGPLTWSALAADSVEGVVDGHVVVSGLFEARGALIVDHVADADRLAVVGENITLYDLCEVETTDLKPLDPLTPVARVDRFGRGERIGGPDEVRDWTRRGACLTAAALVGATRLALQLARDHVVGRHQFGRSVGSFQSVKHMLADMAVGLEVAGAAVTQAAEAIDSSDADAARFTWSAKALAGDAATQAARWCIQLHGAMGYTWEADPHLIWKRVLLWDSAFGDSDAQALLVAQSLGRRGR